VKKNPTLLCN